MTAMTQTSSTPFKGLLLIFVACNATTKAFQVPRSSSTRPRTTTTATTTATFPTIRRYSEPDDQRSIGEVVQGLHGGKYQFSNAGVNFEGQQFADTGYGSGELQVDNYDDEPIPNWALKLQDMNPSDKKSNFPEEEVSLAQGSAVVEVKNEERSWEKYYAYIVGDDAGSLIVEPRLGMLAPRGSGGPDFSDTTQLQISGDRGRAKNGHSWLVVGTEADTWTYKLNV